MPEELLFEAPLEGQPQAESPETPTPQAPEAEVQKEPESHQEAPEKGQLIGGKFKSYEDLLKSYEEAQRELTRKSQELAKLQAQYEALWKQFAAPAQEEKGSAPADDTELLNELLASPRKAIEKILQQYTAPLMAALSKLQTEQYTNYWTSRERFYEERYKDVFSAIKPRVYEYIRTNPHLLQKKEGYDEAVKAVIGEMVLEGKFVAPGTPKVEAPKPSPGPQYSREVYEFAKTTGRKPEEAYRILQAIREGKPVYMEDLSPEED